MCGAGIDSACSKGMQQTCMQDVCVCVCSSSNKHRQQHLAT